MPAIAFPWPINVKARGTVNGTRFTVNGAGVIRTLGVYDAILNFDRMPTNFHPGAISTFTVSLSCGAGASMRQGGKNLSIMGIEEYEVYRRLDVAGGEIHLHGAAVYTPAALMLDVEINGDAKLPEDVICHSVYFKRLYQESPGVILGVGDASLFRSDGSDIPVEINTKYHVKPNPLPNPMNGDEYRVATEDGTLYGLSYHLRIHSNFDGRNNASILGLRKCKI